MPFPRFSRATLGVAALYVLVVGLMTWPAGRFLNDQLIGNNEDTWIFFWNNWWFGEAIASGRSLFFTPYLFHPTGTSLVAHSNSFLNSFFAWLLEPLTGPIAAYNLVLLAGLWLGAVGAFLLVKELTGHVSGAALAGFVYAFAPYHVSQLMAHAHLGSIHWWPYFALFFLRALRNGRGRDAGLAGLFAALTVWTGLQLGVFLALWALAFTVAHLWRRRQNIWRDRPIVIMIGRQIALTGFVALVLTAPVVWQIATEWSDLAAGAGVFDESLRKQTDLLSYFVPPVIHPLWGDRFPELYARFAFNGTFRPYPGFAALILAALAAWGWPSRARFWLASGGLWLLLAAGSALRFNGVVYEQLPLPYRWLATTFPISAIRAPDRFNLLLVLSLAVLVGLGAARLAGHPKGRVLLGLLGSVLILEYLMFPIPRWELPPTSPYLAELAGGGSAEAVVDVPMGYTDAKYWLYFQTLHGRPTVEGHLSRYNADTYAFINREPFLNALYQAADWPQYLPPVYFEPRQSHLPALGPALRSLRVAGIRYILVHTISRNEAELAHAEDILFPFFPIFEDASLRVYDLDRPRPVHFGRHPELIAPGVRLVSATVRLDSSSQTLVLDLLTEKTGSDAPAGPCQISLPGAKIPFQPLPGTVAYAPGDLAFQTVALPLPQELPPGRHPWKIACDGASPYAGPEGLIFGENGPFLLGEHPSLHFQDGINLDGYRWWTDRSDLYLALRWSARENIGRDYKFFVHLIDEGGTILRQHDAIHCSWGCPTGGWVSGQVVEDEVILPLWGLPPGEYRLAAGLYDGETGERLPLQAETGNSENEGYMIFDETIEVREN